MARKIANIGGQYWPLVEMPDFLTIWPKVSKKPVISTKMTGFFDILPAFLTLSTGFFDTFDRLF